MIGQTHDDKKYSNKAQCRPAVKVCGLTRPDDVQLCLDLGADFTGFIFAAQSPRSISPEAAAGLPRGNAARVGVFAGHTPTRVLEIMRVARLDFAQLHGNESPEHCRAIGPERVIKVLWPERLLSADGNGKNGKENFLSDLHKECERFSDVCACFLLDAGRQGGGSGKELPRELLNSFSPSRPWLLAGNVGPVNARTILAGCSPLGLDCNSAVEISPGEKDHGKLQALFKELGR